MTKTANGIFWCACAMGGLALTACGPTELNDLAPEETQVVRQAGKTDQGKTDQGKTDQGMNTTGTRLIINRGAWQFRQGTGYVTGWGDLAPGVEGLPGTNLMLHLNTGGTMSLTGTYVWDQDNGWHVDPLTGLKRSNGAPLATFYAQKLSPSGGTSTLIPVRVVNSTPDLGPYNSPGYWDAQNLLNSTYRAGINSSATPNSDIRFYKVQIQSEVTGQWVDLCQGGGPGNKAIFMPGYFDWSGRYIKNPQYLGVTCWDGTAAKCMRWGYRPWRSLTSYAGVQQLEPFWQACVRAAKADYCSDGTSYTEDGRPIDLWDRYNFISKSPESGSWMDSNGRPDAYSDESAFDASGAVCLVRERLFNTNFNTATCQMTTTFLNGGEFCSQQSIPGGTWSSCGPKGTVSTPTNVFDRGSLNSCDRVASRPPLVYVASFDSGCSSHTPTQSGRALSVDCNCLTNSICTTKDPVPLPAGQHPWKDCCAEDLNGHLIEGKWDAQCINRANSLLNRPISVCPLVLAQSTSATTATTASAP